MGNRERILSLVRSRPGLTDTQIGELTGVRPHQQVNQICRRLEAESVTRRVTGAGGFIINVPVGGEKEPGDVVVSATSVADGSVEDARKPQKAASVRQLATSGVVAGPGSLVVTACSKRKRPGKGADPAPQSILNGLREDLASELRAARARNAEKVGLDESTFGCWRAHRRTRPSLSGRRGHPNVRCSC